MNTLQASAFAFMMGNRSNQASSAKKKKTQKRRTTKSFGGEAGNCKVDPSTLPVLVKPQDSEWTIQRVMN